MRMLTEAETALLTRERDRLIEDDQRRRSTSLVPALALFTLVCVGCALGLRALLVALGVPDDIARLVTLVLATAVSILGFEGGAQLRRRAQEWAQQRIAHLDAVLEGTDAARVEEDPDGLHRVFTTSDNVWIGSIVWENDVPTVFLPAPPRGRRD